MPHYLPLRSSSFNEVVLELTDGMGNLMKLKAIVWLYFISGKKV